MMAAIPTRIETIITIPCNDMSVLYSIIVRNCIPDSASSVRKIRAKIPPILIKIMLRTMYWMPMTLWSSETPKYLRHPNPDSSISSGTSSPMAILYQSANAPTPIRKNIAPSRAPNTTAGSAFHGGSPIRILIRTTIPNPRAVPKICQINPLTSPSEKNFFILPPLFKAFDISCYGFNLCLIQYVFKIRHYAGWKTLHNVEIGFQDRLNQVCCICCDGCAILKFYLVSC